MAEGRVEEAFDVRRYLMDALPVSISRRVLLPPFVGGTARWEVQRDYLDHEREAMVLDLRAYVLARHLADDEYVAQRVVPLTWRDMRREYRRSAVLSLGAHPWRRRLLSLVWRRDLRRPVETRRVELRVKVARYMAYGEADVPVPERLGKGRPVEVVALERVGDWEDTIRG